MTSGSWGMHVVPKTVSKLLGLLCLTESGTDAEIILCGELLIHRTNRVSEPGLTTILPLQMSV
jgi:hypothetical protein